MGRRLEPEPPDHDEQLGEAIEAYLALAETGPPPEPEVFAARYPELGDDLIAALEGLALVQGLVGDPSGPGPGSRLETGRRIAGYRIVRELGRGGMGVVYEAVHVGLDRPVALKVLGSQAAPDSGGRRRFLNEARTAAGLHHTHIVPVFDVGQVGSLCYYAMQRIEGSGLDRVIRHLRRDRATAAGSSTGGGSSPKSRLGNRFTPWPLSKSRAGSSASKTGPWPPSVPANDLSGLGNLAGTCPADEVDEPPPFQPPRGSAYYRWVAEVGREAAEALGHAHHRGIIHRDVKPSNLLVDGRGFVWVADFGLARRLADPSLTQHDSLLGTPRYMSPEQARVGPIDGRTDLYSLGATLYELLTLRPPFEGQCAAELIEQIAQREPIAPRLIDPRVPRDLETIVLKLLSKRPADRYATSAELAEDLTRFLNYEPVRARRISPIGRAWRFARRHPGITAVSTAAAIAILAVTTVAYVKVLHERDQAIMAGDQAIKAVRTQLLVSAELVRKSNVPNRRIDGLKLIGESAALNPEPPMQTRLRNEAVEFLVMRDVEARPGFPTGRSRALAFVDEGSRLVALTQSAQGGESLSVWDVAGRNRVDELTLRAPSASPLPDPAATPRPANGSGPGSSSGQGRLPRLRGPAWPWLVSAGTDVAAITSDASQGVRLIDPGATGRARSLKLETPGHSVRGLFATPDGRRLVTLEGPRNTQARNNPGGPPQARPTPGRRTSFVVNLWNSESPSTPVATLARSDPDETAQTFPLVAVSPDGKAVATAWFHKMSVSIWSAETGTDLGAIETQSELTALALGPDNQLATAGSGEVRLWDTESRTALPSLAPNQSEVRLLRFSPRGSLLAIAGRDGRDVELWDTSAHSVVAVLPTPDQVEDVVFSPDGRTLAAATTGETTPVWAVIEPAVRARINGFDAVTRTLAFRADGLLALGIWKGTLRFWDAGHCVQTATSADTEADDEVDPAREQNVVRDRERPTPMAFDNLGNLVTLEPDGLRIWANPPRSQGGPVTVPLSLSQPRSQSFFGFGRGNWLLAASPNGQTLAIAHDGSIFLRRASDPKTLVPVKVPPELAHRVRDRDFNRDRGDRGPRPDRGPFVPPLNWRALALSPKGDRLYLVEAAPPDMDAPVRAWALEGARARSLEWPGLPADAMGLALALSGNGKVLAVGSRSGVVTLIETDKGTTLARLTSPPVEGVISSLTLSSDGKELAVGTSQGSIQLWSLADPSAPILRLPGHRSPVASLAFDARSRHLASASNDKTVDIWDLARIRAEFARLKLAW